MPEPIRRIASRYLRDPQQVKIRAATTTVATIRQKYWLVRGADKLEALTRMLEVEADFDAAIVFVRTKTATVDIAEKLEARGYAVAALNGDLTQGLREQVIERLKSGALDIVVATDVAARGLDVPRVSHVINYDIPYDTEAYVHRIGRTGRAGRAGVAILFVSSREMRMLKAIERATRQPIEPIALPTRGEVAERRVAQFRRQIMDTLAAENLDFFYEVVRRMEAEDGLATRQIAAALAFLSQKDRPLRPDGMEEIEPAVPLSRGEPAGAVPSAPIFERPQKRERKPHAAPAPKHDFGHAPTLRYCIEVGKNQGVMPKEIVGAIANEGGIDGKLIGQINLFDDYSTVELPELPADILATLKRTRVKQLPLKIRAAAPGEGDKPAFARSRRPDGDVPRPRRPAGADFSKKPAFRGEKKPAGEWKTRSAAGKPDKPGKR